MGASASVFSCMGARKPSYWGLVVDVVDLVTQGRVEVQVRVFLEDLVQGCLPLRGVGFGAAGADLRVAEGGEGDVVGAITGGEGVSLRPAVSFGTNLVLVAGGRLQGVDGGVVVGEARLEGWGLIVPGLWGLPL